MKLIYRGSSPIDGKPIVCLLTGDDAPSRNIKTGPMLQTWVLRDDVSPVEAVRSKQDVSICGECKHRNSTCYVLVHQAPSMVWRSYVKRKESISVLTPHELTRLGFRKNIRVGSYGDPATVPFPIWEALTKTATSHTGYTHLWDEDNVDTRFRTFLQASVDTEDEYRRAKKKGWMTFRIKTSNAGLLGKEIICPNVSTEGLVQCSTCRLCNGSAKDIAIDVHGAINKITAYNRRVHESL